MSCFLSCLVNVCPSHVPSCAIFCHVIAFLNLPNPLVLIKRRHCGRLVYVIDLASINATVVSSTVI